ncbi:hypothetical protein [Bradyrhizobium arachidis]|uniref:hypothetical protein n=1 Tax=Bradyrhizobium arachidis TaxID=858423 RepID=UPI00142E6BD5|nr:hypothetical protein [Bradyrhizobium arachidis]
MIGGSAGGFSPKATGFTPVCQWRGLTALSDNDLHFKIAVIALGAFSAVLAIRLIFSF